MFKFQIVPAFAAKVWMVQLLKPHQRRYHLYTVCLKAKQCSYRETNCGPNSRH